LIKDGVRFLTTEKCEYDKFVLYFGRLENSIVEKWYCVNEDKEIFETIKSSCNGVEAIRILGYSGNSRKFFYMPKIKKTRVECKSAMNVFKARL
jgi:hypothetical protein